jgi:hypothetical protein
MMPTGRPRPSPATMMLNPTRRLPLEDRSRWLMI